MSLEPLQLLLIDLDGTLVDTSLDLQYAANCALQPFGFAPFDPRSVTQAMGRGAAALLSKLSKNALKDADLQVAIQRFMQVSHENQGAHSRLFPGIKTWLESGCQMAIVSNKNRLLVEDVLARLQLEHYFEQVIAGDDLPRKKPFPDQIFEVLQRLQVQPRAALMIGDAREDILAGKAAGVHTCGVTWGFGQPETAAPDVLINHPAQLLKCFRPKLSP